MDDAIIMPDDQEREAYERRLREIVEEEAFDARMVRVFATPDGIEVAEWLLQLFGYWRPVKDVQLYETGRLFMHKLGAASLDLWTQIVARQHQRAMDERAEEKKKFNQAIRERR
jgi:alkylation response protein AidB-like acyl-CoA dehydrogenase